MLGKNEIKRIVGEDNGNWRLADKSFNIDAVLSSLHQNKTVVFH